MSTDDTQKFLNLKNARTKEQVELMEKIAQDGVCPFCAEYFRKYHPKPIIKETDSWFLTENMSPYKGTKVHLLLVYKKAHVQMPSDVDAEGRVELFDLINEAVQMFSIKGGSFLMRFGDTDYNGSSVQHLHAHLIVSDIENENGGHLRIKV